MSRQFWEELIWWVTIDGTAVANTTTETAIFSAVTIPANYMTDGRVLQVTAQGRLSSVTAPTIRFRLRWGTATGGVVLWDSGVITTNSATAALWAVEIMVQTRTNGATGTLFAIGQCLVGSAAAPTVASATGAPAIGVFGSAGDDTPAAATCDLTADTALNLTATWSAASASNTLTGHNYFGESLN